MSKGSTISFEESDVLVENRQLKGVDIIRLQPIGTKKEHLIKFDVRYTCRIVYIYYSVRVCGMRCM